MTLGSSAQARCNVSCLCCNLTTAASVVQKRVQCATHAAGAASPTCSAAVCWQLLAAVHLPHPWHRLQSLPRHLTADRQVRWRLHHQPLETRSPALPCPPSPPPQQSQRWVPRSGSRAPRAAALSAERSGPAAGSSAIMLQVGARRAVQLAAPEAELHA